MADLTAPPTTNDDTTPVNLADLDDAALAAHIDELVAAFDEIHDSTDPDVHELAVLAERVEAAQAEKARRGGIAPVAAAVTRRPRVPDLAAVARHAPRPTPSARRPDVAITAAGAPADGPRLSLVDVAQSLHDTARRMRDGGPGRLVARVHVPYEHEPIGNDPAHNISVIDDVVGNRTAEALVASGGWCAPSQPIFELFDLGPDAAGLIDLPAISARGGALIPMSFGIGDTDGALWTWTEADDIAAVEPDGPRKPCLRIPCPTWTECVMEAEGLCVTHGNLADRAFPELTVSFVRTVYRSHLHRVSAAKIAKIVADATAVAPGASMLVSDAAADVLGVIELQAVDLRSKYRLAPNRTLDVGAPEWLLPALRANLAMRAGVDLLNVSDALLRRWFTDRGIRLQTLADYQPLNVDGAVTTAWPNEVTILIWLAGSYLMLDGGQLDLGVVRDSTLNATNDFTAAFSEQFFQVCRRGPAAREVTIPLSIDGVTGCCPNLAEAA